MKRILVTLSIVAFALATLAISFAYRTHQGRGRVAQLLDLPNGPTDFTQFRVVSGGREPSYAMTIKNNAGSTLHTLPTKLGLARVIFPNEKKQLDAKIARSLSMAPAPDPSAIEVYVGEKQDSGYFIELVLRAEQGLLMVSRF